MPRQAEGFVEVGFRSVGIGIDLEISQPAVNAAEAAEILKPLADAEGFFAEANGLIRINIGNVGSLQRKGSRVQQRCVLRAGFFRCARGGAGGILKVRKSTGSDGFRQVETGILRSRGGNFMEGFNSGLGFAGSVSGGLRQ